MKNSSKGPELAVVIPVYNEVEIIRTVLESWDEELTRLGIDYEIHVYNDGSKDNTLKVLRDCASSMKRVVVHDKPNSGHGPTILLGYRENSDKEWLFQIDSDNEMSAVSFEKLWKRRRDFDILLGSRHGRTGPLSRQLISFISRATVRLLYGPGIYDVNIPYRLMRSNAFAEVFKKIPPDTFAPNVIVSGVACKKRFRILDISIDYNFRQTGEVYLKNFKLLESAIKSFWQTLSFSFSVKS